MKIRNYYVFEVPEVIRMDGKGPRTPAHVGGICLRYENGKVLYAVSRGGFNYLKNRSYARLIAENVLYRDLDFWRKIK